MLYRSEIDGLRAIAIVPVILYHAGFHRFFAGGYVGVDIFFVISGYLITSLIDAELDEHNFSLVRFYQRRCRRILPALFFILFASSVFAYYWMMPEQLKEVGQTLLSILGLSSNIFFWWKDDGYFTQLTERNPLVHTWSLAVEEQFYLLFPLLCLFFRHQRHRLIVVVFSLTVISFSLAQWGGNLHTISVHRWHMFAQHPSASFYLPVGRVWELLLGSLASFYLKHGPHSALVAHKQLLSMLGFLLIVLAVVYCDSRLLPPFPNMYTLAPTCGALLIVVFGDSDTLIGRVLSTRPCRWIGLISYSAYLWHQPLFVFLRLYSVDFVQDSLLILTMVAILPLSILSYKCIEQPFRDKSRLSRKQVFLGAALGSCVTLIVALFLIQTSINRSVAMSQAEDPYLYELQQYSDNYVFGAFHHRGIEGRPFSNSTIRGNKKKLALIGDSFSQDFYNMIIEGNYLNNYEIRVYFVYSPCQIYIGNEDRLQFIEPEYRQLCTNAHDIKYALPLIREADVVILATSWHEWSAKRLPMTLKLLNLTQQQQIFVIGSKHFGEVKPMVYVKKTIEYRLKQRLQSNSKTTALNDLLEKTIDPSMFVNVQKHICTGWNHTCVLFTPQGKLISFDGAHLTKFGAIYVGKLIFKNKPLNRL